MTETFSVAIDFSGQYEGDPEDINKCMGSLADGLQDYDPAVIGCPEQPVDSTGRYGARILIDADGASEAVAGAISIVKRAVRATDLPDWPVARIEAVEWSELERQLERPIHPRPIGINELAQLLGISRQRASALARTSRFPAPAAELASGPVWFEDNVRRFAAEWERKPGRPMSPRTIERAAEQLLAWWNTGAQSFAAIRKRAEELGGLPVLRKARESLWFELGGDHRDVHHFDAVIREWTRESGLDPAILAASRGAPFPDPMHEMSGLTTMDIPVPTEPTSEGAERLREADREKRTNRDD